MAAVGPKSDVEKAASFNYTPDGLRLAPGMKLFLDRSGGLGEGRLHAGYLPRAPELSALDAKWRRCAWWKGEILCAYLVGITASDSSRKFS